MEAVPFSDPRLKAITFGAFKRWLAEAGVPREHLIAASNVSYLVQVMDSAVRPAGRALAPGLERKHCCPGHRSF